jgi:hypothetical protein
MQRLTQSHFPSTCREERKVEKILFVRSCDGHHLQQLIYLSLARTHAHIKILSCRLSRLPSSYFVSTTRQENRHYYCTRHWHTVQHTEYHNIHFYISHHDEVVPLLLFGTVDSNDHHTRLGRCSQTGSVGKQKRKQQEEAGKQGSKD